MFAVFLSYKYYLNDSICSSGSPAFSSLSIDKHSVTDVLTKATKKGLRIRDGP